MKIIRSKRDISAVMQSFASWAAFDALGKKHYFVFKDEQRDGEWTLMRNQSERWSRHGKGETYCENGETWMTDKEVIDFLWMNRRAVNASRRKKITTPTV